MNTSIILDTGPLVALVSRDDRDHTWAKSIWATLTPPLLTCDAVIVESCFLLRNLYGGEESIFRLLDRNVIQLNFDLAAEHPAIRSLIQQYKSVPMSVADACLVRMSELDRNSSILTLDSDFLIYRRNRSQTIPTIMPSRKI